MWVQISLLVRLLAESFDLISPLNCDQLIFKDTDNSIGYRQVNIVWAPKSTLYPHSNQDCEDDKVSVVSFHNIVYGWSHLAVFSEMSAKYKNT